MGYHLTILRSANGRQLPIPLEEATLAARGLGWEFHDDPPTFALSLSEGTAVLWHQDDELWTKNPEEWAIAPMVALAGVLGGRLRGDEFETYGVHGNTFLHSDDLVLRKEAERASCALIAEGLRETRRIRNFIVGFFVVLGAIGFLVGKAFEG